MRMFGREFCHFESMTRLVVVELSIKADQYVFLCTISNLNEEFTWFSGNLDGKSLVSRDSSWQIEQYLLNLSPALSEGAKKEL